MSLLIAAVIYACAVEVAVAAPFYRVSDADPVVTCAAGTFTGKSAQGVDSFLGIRYAEPPVGKLRFLPARPTVPGTFSAKKSVKHTRAPNMLTARRARLRRLGPGQAMQ